MNLSVGILTHRSPVTLYNTILSYKVSGLLDLVDDVFCVIQASDKSHQEAAVCSFFQVRAVLLPDNGMMAWGIKRVFEEAKHEAVLFLESDFRCLVSTQITKDMLSYALKTILSDEANIIRLRSLKYPGHPIQAKSFIGKETMDEDHLRQLYLCTHYLAEPEKTFPDYITLVHESPRVYKMSSKNCVYTNNPTMMTKRFYTNNILPYIQFGKHLEPEIDVDWNTKYDHTIYITQGIFTHVRLDGHEGKNCWCCPIQFGGESDISTCVCCRGETYNPKVFEESDLYEFLPVIT
jgi:hypothetical protein